MITIIVNGNKETIAPGVTIGGYLASKGIDPAVAVVEINKSIARKEDFGTTAFNNKDTVEILRFVGGG